MIRRFLRYSLRHQRPIKVLFSDEEGTIKALNLRVTELREDCFSYFSASNRKTPRELPIASLLSCAYGRGDHGEIGLPSENDEMASAPSEKE